MAAAGVAHQGRSLMRIEQGGRSGQTGPLRTVNYLCEALPALCPEEQPYVLKGRPWGLKNRPTT